jgi:tRNA pseudouridine32 synthase / 23S rRNA pseudouridine746 synthase
MMGRVPEGNSIHLKRTVAEGDPHELGAFLQKATGLSRGAIKNALAKGALRVRRSAGGGFRRVRKADASLAPGDLVELGYDPELLAREAPEAELLEDLGQYSFWWKPAGLLAQGNAFGDHCSILRQVEIWANGKARETYLVQRLDREALGVMAFAHDRRAAAEISRELASGRARKLYRAVVHGTLELRAGRTGRFEASLDGLAAVTSYEVLSYDRVTNRSTVAVTLRGGRLHQIRRHFSAAGYPLVGDPRYGRGDAEPLRLAATSLRFHSALLGREVGADIPEGKIEF